VQSALTISKLHKTIVEFFHKDLEEAELFLPWTAQNLRGEINANCHVIGERSEDERAYFQIRGGPNVVSGLREQLDQDTQ